MRRRHLERALAAVFLPIWLTVVTLLLPWPDLPWPDPHRPQATTWSPVDAWEDMDADMLADVALGEDPDALDAVMWTVVNRARLSGRLIEAEIRDGHAYGSVIGEKWVPAWRRMPGRRWRGMPWEWRRAVAIARDVLAGRIPDPTHGATHFHRRGTWSPPWAPDPRAWKDLGEHHFYTPPTSG